MAGFAGFAARSSLERSFTQFPIHVRSTLACIPLTTMEADDLYWTCIEKVNGDGDGEYQNRKLQQHLMYQRSGTLLSMITKYALMINAWSMYGRYITKRSAGVLVHDKSGGGISLHM